LLLFVSLQAVQVVNGTLGVRGCREDGALIFAEHLQPVPQIGGVIVAGLGRDAEISTQERRSEFGNQFLGGIGMVAKALAQDSRQAGWVGGPVGIMPISA